MVEGDVDLANTLAYQLRQDGLEATIVHTSAEALESATLGSPPHAIVLDTEMPDLSGLEVCRRLRRAERTRAVPILLCSTRAEELDRIVGLEIGADDYLVKPYSVRELSLRVRKFIRRTQFAAEKPDERHLGPVIVDRVTQQVEVAGRVVKLTAHEYRLLNYFVDCAGRVVTREQIMRDVWDEPDEVSTKTVDTHVKRLRDKLGKEFSDQLEAVRKVGYRLRGEKAVVSRPST